MIKARLIRISTNPFCKKRLVATINVPVISHKPSQRLSLNFPKLTINNPKTKTGAKGCKSRLPKTTGVNGSKNEITTQKSRLLISHLWKR